MPREPSLARVLPACLAALIAACAAPAPTAAPAAQPSPAIEQAPPTPPAPPSPPAPAPAPAAPSVRSDAHPLETLVAYAERLRGLPAPELAAETQRLGEGGYGPLRATQLALVLAQSRTAANATRAQALLQRVLADGSSEAQTLHPYARLLAAQIAEQRRAEEAAERQAQQLRDAQRRIDQLNDRLEAVRAIERSLPGPARREPAR